MGNSLIAQPRSLIVPRRGFRKPARPVLDPSDPINRGLSGRWLCGVRVTGKTPDISPYRRDGTLVNSPPLAASHHGGLTNSFAAASTQYIDCGKGFVATKTTPMSGVLYLKTTDTGNGVLIGNWNVTVNPGWCFQLANPNIQFVESNAGGQTLFLAKSTATINDGKWHCLGWSYTGSAAASGITIYVDGVPGQTTNTTGDPGAFVDYKLTLMNLDLASSPHYLPTGTADDFGLWIGRCLSASDHARLAAEPYAGIVEAAPRWRVGTAAAPGFTAVNRRTLGPRVGSRSVYG